MQYWGTYIRCQLSMISEWSELYLSMMSSMASSGSVSSPTTDSLSESSSSSDAASASSSSGLLLSSLISKSSCNWNIGYIVNRRFSLAYFPRKDRWAAPRMGCPPPGAGRATFCRRERERERAPVCCVAWRSPDWRLSTGPVYSAVYTCTAHCAPIRQSWGW